LGGDEVPLLSLDVWPRERFDIVDMPELEATRFNESTRQINSE
jgi:hypothetical protein